MYILHINSLFAIRLRNYSMRIISLFSASILLYIHATFTNQYITFKNRQTFDLDEQTSQFFCKGDKILLEKLRRGEGQKMWFRKGFKKQ